LKRHLLSIALVFILTLGLGISLGPLFEKKIYDQKVRAFSRRAGSPIVLVEIDQESIDFYHKNFNVSWPWPRSLHGRAIAFLAASHVRAIALDLILSEPSPYGGEDEQLAAAMKKAGNVFLPLFFSSKDGPAEDIRRFSLSALPLRVRPPARKSVGLPVPMILAEMRGGGNGMENPDRDGVYRRLHHGFRYRGSLYPSFSLALALAVDPGLRTGDVPFASDGGLILKFYDQGSFRRYSISELIQSQVLLEEGQPPSVPSRELEGKIVVIGPTATGLLDNRPSPVNAAGSGFELHATALANFLERDFTRVIDPRLQWLFILLAIAWVNCFLPGIRSIQMQLLAGAGIVLLAVAANLLLFRLGFDMDLLPLLLGLTVCVSHDVYRRYQRVRREKKFIEKAFKGYMSDSLLAEIMKNPQALNLGGEKKLVTIFFSDLAGFTSLSERLPPEEVVHILNRYLERMTAIIMENGGYIDKYEGDAIMAFWGAPLASGDQAARAMRAALRCQEELQALNLDLEKGGLPRLGMRVGVNSGEVIVGNVGSSSKLGYTVIGDAVNLASRLEGINKQYGTKVICGALSRRMASEQVVVRRLDRVRVKGKQVPEEIFEVVAEKEKAPAGLPGRMAEFEKGLLQYFAGDFAGALEVFMPLADDPPAQVFARRCLYLLDNPPENWDGCWTFTEK
jgi:adenylate cyclase